MIYLEKKRNFEVIIKSLPTILSAVDQSIT